MSGYARRITGAVDAVVEAEVAAVVAEAPDPGNSPPEDWTEPLDPAEAEEIADLLRRELGGD